MAKITLAKALKEKNKIVNTIRELETKIQQYNVTVKGNNFVYNTIDLLAALRAETVKLIVLKAAIFEANEPIYKDILELSEAKSHLKFLRSLNVQEGIADNNYSEKETSYINQINVVKRDVYIEEYQTMVDNLQEKIDAFNHTTTIHKEEL